MGQMLVPNDGVRGIDVTTEKGTVKYDADKSGRITVDNPAHARSLKANGFTMAAGVSGFAAPGYPCEGCGFNSLFKVYKCWKCGTENDYRN